MISSANYKLVIKKEQTILHLQPTTNITKKNPGIPNLPDEVRDLWIYEVTE